ncbi:MAG: ABC transporter permease [Clostridia bacterium]|nr:ABC transporter permease [Clostridia bacterium]
MIKKTLKTLKRAPVRAVAVLLFAAVITMIICALQASNEAELRNYEEAYQAVPVTVTVTDPMGNNTDPSSIKPWVLDLLTGESTVELIDTSAAKDFEESVSLKDKVDPVEVSLAEYLKDVQIKMSHFVSRINGNEYNQGEKTYLIGMTSLSCDKQLLPEYGCEITWYEGYDESIFAGDDPVCIVPEAMAKPRYYNNGKGEAPLYFRTSVVNFVKDEDGFLMPVPQTSEYSCTLKIVGTYTAGDEKSIYCPYPVVEQVHGELEAERFFDSISATIADNRRLEEFREIMSLCFTEPSSIEEQLHWGSYVINRSNSYYNAFYDYALDINDDNLFDLSAVLEESIKFNRTVTLIVVALSVIAGFLVGFLMIRRRKRDILLMRMVGESNARVYVGFALEQMICIILGIVIGGAYYNWNPMDKLIIFAVAYFIALSLALAIFMSKKLINNIKEDE